MNDNYKDNIKHHKSSFALILLTCTIIIVLASALFLYFNKSTKSIPELNSKKTQVLNGKNAQDIIRIELNSKNKGNYAIIRENTQYRLENNSSYPINQDVAQNMFDAAASIQADELIFEKFKKTELENQKIAYIELKVKYSDTSEDTWLFTEDIDKHLNKQYILNPDNALYVTSLNYFDALNYSIEQMHEIPDLEIKSDKLKSIKLKNNNQTLELIKNHDFWEILKPLNYISNSSYIDSFLNKLNKIMLSSYVCEGNSENIKNLGINDNFYIIISYDENKIEHKNPREIKLYFGKRHNSVARYCLFENKIYLASDFAFNDILSFNPNKFFSERFINIPAARLKKIELKTHEDTYKFQLELVEQLKENNELVKDEFGNTVFDIWISLNGKKIKESDFLNAYQELLHTNAISLSRASKPTAAPEYELLFETENKSYSYKLYKNTNNYTLYINDTSIYEFENNKIDDVLKKLISLNPLQ